MYELVIWLLMIGMSLLVVTGLSPKPFLRDALETPTLNSKTKPKRQTLSSVVLSCSRFMGRSNWGELLNGCGFRVLG